jgi:hypothetical protein
MAGRYYRTNPLRQFIYPGAHMTTARGTNDLTETGDSPQFGPTVLRMLVGGHLRRLRESRGITRDDAGYAIQSSHSTISHLELGRTGFKPDDVATLLETELDDVICLRQIAGAQYLTRKSDVLPYQHLMNKLVVHAQPATATPGVIRQIISTL